ncbi:MAG TPA: hypothetical protein VLF39_03435 [Candidatus Saccharimonadales bacterium]|nr:hypothetical protein [Candidatus Saccharimonadales bacterium]
MTSPESQPVFEVVKPPAVVNLFEHMNDQIRRHPVSFSDSVSGPLRSLDEHGNLHHLILRRFPADNYATSEMAVIEDTEPDNPSFEGINTQTHYYIYDDNDRLSIQKFNATGNGTHHRLRMGGGQEEIDVNISLRDEVNATRSKWDKARLDERHQGIGQINEAETQELTELVKRAKTYRYSRLQCVLAAVIDWVDEVSSLSVISTNVDRLPTNLNDRLS